MASPFSIFRKNQRLMFALLTVMVMFGFVFLPILMETMGTRSVSNAVVVKTKFGDLYESDLRELVMQRRRVQGVLTSIMEQAGQNPQMVHQWLESQMGPATEEAVVTTWIMARTAEKQGMVMSNRLINDYLRQITGDRVKSNVIAVAIQRSGLSDSMFFDAMREELTALQFDRMFQVSLRGTTPAERWDYFCRSKQMATIEAVALPVEHFLPQIDDPTENELKQFFEEYKTKLSYPNSPEPGFRQPQKVALEWFKADNEKIMSPEFVTDEEVKERYEKNKEFYEPPAKKSEGESNPEVKAEEPKAQESAPAEQPKEPEAEKKEPASEGKPGETSAVAKSSPFQLTSFLEEEKPAETAAAAPAADAKPAETPAAEAKPAEPAAAETKPAETTAAEAKPAETTAASTEKPAEAKPEMAEATKNRIRGEIGREKLQKIFSKLNTEIEQYRREFSKYEIALLQFEKEKKEGATAPVPPAKPDLQKLANENGLSVGRMELSTQWEVQPSDVGQAYVGMRTPLWIFAFQSMPKYRGELAFDLKGDEYLFWSTDETKERVPKFDEEGVRERVLRDWKMIKARKLAKEKADAMVEEALKSGKSLKETFADAQVITPPAFSWLTSGSVAFNPNLRISEVPGIVRPGDDFMKVVFHTAVGGVADAFNAPKNIVYVIRLNDFVPSLDVLWQQFEVDDFRKYASASQEDREQMMRAWLEQIRKSAGVKWMRKADEHETAQSKDE